MRLEKMIGAEGAQESILGLYSREGSSRANLRPIASFAASARDPLNLIYLGLGNSP